MNQDLSSGQKKSRKLPGKGNSLTDGSSSSRFSSSHGVQVVSSKSVVGEQRRMIDIWNQIGTRLLPLVLFLSSFFCSIYCIKRCTIQSQRAVAGAMGSEFGYFSCILNGSKGVVTWRLELCSYKSDC